MNSQNLDDTNPLRATANSSPMLQQTSSCLQIRRSSDKSSRLSSGHILPDPKKKSPSSESRTFMSYYSENGGLLYRSYSSGHLRKRSIFCDELDLWFPAPLYPWCCTHAMITPCLMGISLTDMRLTKRVIDFGGRRYIITSKLGALIAALVSDVNHRIVGPS